MMFKCPVCKSRHSVPDNYDNKEFICQNGGLTPKTFQKLRPNDLLSRNAYNFNRSSIREDVNRPATVHIGGPGYRPTGEKIGKLKRNY